MRVVVLYTRLSGYIEACLRALRRQYDATLLVVRDPVDRETAPYEESLLEWVDELYDRSLLDVQDLIDLVEEFDPDRLLMGGLKDPVYLRVARKLKSRGVPTIAGSDAQWTGSIRQRAQSLFAPLILGRAIDVLWVAGERQRQMAHQLGYTGPRCWSGFYACDWDRFSSVYERRSASAGDDAFLFVGRHVAAKGIDLLVDAYRHYRAAVDRPWRLICAGTGPEEHRLANEEGIDHRGFVQPVDLPELMGEASAFVLPSRREPWGVVLHEAASAGLPLIASDASGAAVHLLGDRYNGRLFQSGSVEHLTACLKQTAVTSRRYREVMGTRSHELSKQFAPDRWARILVETPIRT